MGKLNQLGTLDEVIELCKTHPKYHPVVDFGHLNARENGFFTDADSTEKRKKAHSGKMFVFVI